MDALATAHLVKIARELLDVCESLLDRASQAALFISDRNNEYQQMLVLLDCFTSSLRITLTATKNGAPWAASYCSSIVDDAAYGRGLLHSMLFLAVDSGLIHNESEHLGFAKLITPERAFTALESHEMIVAYLDYVGATNSETPGADDTRIGSPFYQVATRFNRLSDGFKFCSYYWRSSDAYYFFRCLSSDPVVKQKQCTEFVKCMIGVFENEYELHLDILPQRWQIGISITHKSVAVGDIFIPAATESAHAKLMEVAKDTIRGGGHILIHADVYPLLSEGTDKLFRPTSLPVKKDPYYFYTSPMQRS